MGFGIKMFLKTPGLLRKCKVIGHSQDMVYFGNVMTDDIGLYQVKQCEFLDTVVLVAQLGNIAHPAQVGSSGRFEQKIRFSRNGKIKRFVNVIGQSHA
jgi:hypothetical protein